MPVQNITKKNSVSNFAVAMAVTVAATASVPTAASAARGSVSNNSSIVQLPSCASQALLITLDSGSARGKTEAMEALRVFASYASLSFTPVRTEDNFPAMRIAFAPLQESGTASGAWTEIQWRLKPLKSLEVACDTTLPAPAPAVSSPQPEPKADESTPRAESFKARETIQASEVSIAKVVDEDGQVISEDEVDWLNDDALGSLLSLSQAKVWRETVADSVGGLESRLVIELRDLQDEVVGRLVKGDDASSVSIEKLTGLQSARYTMAGSRVATISLRSESGVNVIFALKDLKKATDREEESNSFHAKKMDRVRQAEEELTFFDAEMGSEW